MVAGGASALTIVISPRLALVGGCRRRARRSRMTKSAYSESVAIATFMIGSRSCAKLRLLR
jgi:hypothetical protein